jgi:hypothetical protein
MLCTMEDLLLILQPSTRIAHFGLNLPGLSCFGKASPIALESLPPEGFPPSSLALT